MEQAGGVLYDLGTHLIDQVYVLFGMPVSVTSIFANQRNDNAEEPDSVTVLLSYGKGGPLVTVKAGVISVERPEKQLRFWVKGTGGTYRKEGLDVQEDQLKAGKRPGEEGFGIEGVERAGRLVVIEGDGLEERRVENVVPETYGKLYEEFARAVEGGGEGVVPVKAGEARDVLRIIEAARESARLEKTVSL